MSTLGRIVPGLAVLAGYQRSWLAPDLIAGVTVWAVLVPQALGYASLAGMPTVFGLYTALGAMLLYWLWGSSRELNVGPEGTVAVMVATILTPMAATGSEEYAADQGVRLVFARVRSELRDELRNSGIERRIGPDRVYLEVDDAVAAHRPQGPAQGAGDATGEDPVR